MQRMREPRRLDVRTAATSACPITWPPNTRCQPTCGLRPRKRFSSSCSRSSMASNSATAEPGLSAGLFGDFLVGFWGAIGVSRVSDALSCC